MWTCASGSNALSTKLRLRATRFGVSLVVMTVLAFAGTISAANAADRCTRFLGYPRGQWTNCPFPTKNQGSRGGTRTRGGRGLNGRPCDRGTDEVQPPQPMAGSFDTLKANLSAIDRPRTADDKIVGPATQGLDVAGITSSEANESYKVFDAEPVGSVYVVPTSEGFALITDTNAARIGGTLGRDNPIAGGLNQTEDGIAYTWGIAIDDVVGVDMIVGEAVLKATMVKNGFYWVAPEGLREKLAGLRMIAHLDDGTAIAM